MSPNVFRSSIIILPFASVFNVSSNIVFTISFPASSCPVTVVPTTFTSKSFIGRSLLFSLTAFIVKLYFLHITYVGESCVS